MGQRTLLYIIVLVCMVVAVQGTAWARVSIPDGFVAAKKVETFYFTVSMGPGVDEDGLAESLDAGMPAGIIRTPPEIAQSASISGVGLMLDAFYEWATDVLDMQVVGYHGEIKVVRDTEQLQDVYRRLYGLELSEKSFYLHEEDILYVAASDFTKEIVGHELGHVVVSNYFVVQPSAKAAEVLAGYIEFQLRKLIVAQGLDDIEG